MLTRDEVRLQAERLRLRHQTVEASSSAITSRSSKSGICNRDIASKQFRHESFDSVTEERARVDSGQLQNRAYSPNQDSASAGSTNTSSLRKKSLSATHDLDVLLIASERRLKIRMERILNSAGYRTSFVSSGREALRLLTRVNTYQLVLVCDVDDMFPVNICRQVHSKGRLIQSTSLIVLSRNFDADNAIECLTSGASDFISGPHFEDDRVLLARLHVALRGYHLRDRQHLSEDADSLVVGKLTIDPVNYRVTLSDSQIIQLTPLQFRILYRLARRPGRVFLHEELREIASEFGGDPDETTVKSHMSNLRKRLGPASSMIKTVRGFGYSLEEE